MTIDRFYRSHLLAQPPEQLNSVAAWALRPIHYFWGLRVVQIVEGKLIEQAPLHVRSQLEPWHKTIAMILLFIPSLIVGTIVKALSLTSSQVRASLTLPIEQHPATPIKQKRSPNGSLDDTGDFPSTPSTPMSGQPSFLQGTPSRSLNDSAVFCLLSSHKKRMDEADVILGILAADAEEMTARQKQLDKPAYVQKAEVMSPGQLAHEVRKTCQKATLFFNRLCNLPDETTAVQKWLEEQVNSDDYGYYLQESYLMFHPLNPNEAQQQIAEIYPLWKEIYERVCEKLKKLGLEMYIREGIEEIVEDLSESGSSGAEN